MDRPLEPAVRYRAIAWRVAAGALVLLALGGCYALASSLISPTLSKARIRTAIVDRGSVEAVTSASGTVVPEIEQVVSSPIDARVLKILRRPGDALKKGDPIVELDTSASALAIDKVDQDIAIKANAQASVRLELEKTIGDLQSQVDAKRLDLSSLEARVERGRRLASSGLMAATDLRDAELQVSKARIELEHLTSSIANARSATRTRLEGLALEMGTLRKERVEAARLLDLATMVSDRDGVLTWVVGEEGATITRGSIVARIADLGSFRVDATVSDVHAQQIAPGLPVKVKIDDQYLDGAVATVLPTIENGTMKLDVSLNQPSDPRLKANLRVDLYLVTARHADVLRIKKGPFANTDGTHDVFVVRGDRAVRLAAKLGISGVDAYEVVEGLAEGDEVIISDMRDYAHMREIRIR